MNKDRVNITFNPRRRRRQKLKKLTAGIVLGGAAYALAFIAFMNFMFFPDCNRVTRDCFVVEKLWVAHE